MLSITRIHVDGENGDGGSNVFHRHENMLINNENSKILNKSEPRRPKRVDTHTHTRTSHTDINPY